MTQKADGSVHDLRIDAQGCASRVTLLPSPNCDERPLDAGIELVVIHSISLPPGEFGGSDIEALFLNRLNPARHPYYIDIANTKVSAHFLIRREGTIVQFVPCLKRAWHAGISSWRARSRCNDFSIGIELEGCDAQPFEPPQYTSLAQLSQALCDAYPIADIVGHSDIAPGRKTDPGPFFDWEHYRCLRQKKRTRS